MKSPRKFYSTAIFVLVASLVASVAPAQATTYTIFGPFPIITTTYGVGTLVILPPTTNSPGPWSYTSSNPSVATVSGGILNILHAGSSTITATQAATGSYTSRSRSTQLRVSQGSPTFGIFPAQSVSITQKLFTLTPPTSTSDGSWSYTSSNPSIAAITGNKVSLLDGGSVVITATQSITTNWSSASTKMTLTVIALDPKIGTFGDITIMKDSVGSLNLISPSSLSSGSWSFTSSNPLVATIYGSTVTPVAIGTTTITALLSHYGDYSSAKTSMTLTVLGAAPKVGPFPDMTVPFSAGKTVNLTVPTSNSTGGWSFTSSDVTVATVSGATLTVLKPGITTITATQEAIGNYGRSTPLPMTLSVVGTPTIGTWGDIQKVVNDPDFSLTPPTSTSNGLWTFTSSDAKVVGIVGGVVKVVGAGRATITATQAATQIWASATVQIAIQVAGHIPTLGVFAPIVGSVGTAPFAIKSPTSNSAGTWTFSSSNQAVATINGTSISVVGVGTATITATQSAAGEYSQSNTVQTTVTGTPAPTPTPTPKPTITPTPTPTSTKPPVNITVKVTASGRVLTVVAIGVRALVFINGKPGKVGKNTVKAGTASVVITIDDKVVYRRVFTIK